MYLDSHRGHAVAFKGEERARAAPLISPLSHAYLSSHARERICQRLGFLEEEALPSGAAILGARGRSRAADDDGTGGDLAAARRPGLPRRRRSVRGRRALGREAGVESILAASPAVLQTRVDDAGARRQAAGAPLGAL